jgi:hypothetical protein
MSRSTVQSEQRKQLAQLYVYDDLSPVVKALFNSTDELPDNVRNYPPIAQWAFMRTHNNNLRRWGDPHLALAGAWRALQNVMHHLREEASKAGLSLDAYLKIHAHKRGVGQ